MLTMQTTDYFRDGSVAHQSIWETENHGYRSLGHFTRRWDGRPDFTPTANGGVFDRSYPDGTRCVQVVEFTPMASGMSQDFVIGQNAALRPIGPKKRGPRRTQRAA